MRTMPMRPPARMQPMGMMAPDADGDQPDREPDRDAAMTRGSTTLPMSHAPAPKPRRGPPMARSAAHPGFAAVEAQIARNPKIRNPGAVLAASSRNASPAAKRKNPRLKRVGIGHAIGHQLGKRGGY